VTDTCPHTHKQGVLSADAVERCHTKRTASANNPNRQPVMTISPPPVGADVTLSMQGGSLAHLIEVRGKTSRAPRVANQAQPHVLVTQALRREIRPIRCVTKVGFVRQRLQRRGMDGAERTPTITARIQSHAGTETSQPPTIHPHARRVRTGKSDGADLH
jgi:hypothetical protein